MNFETWAAERPHHIIIFIAPSGYMSLQKGFAPGNLWRSSLISHGNGVCCLCQKVHTYQVRLVSASCSEHVCCTGPLLQHILTSGETGKKGVPKSLCRLPSPHPPAHTVCVCTKCVKQHFHPQAFNYFWIILATHSCKQRHLSGRSASTFSGQSRVSISPCTPIEARPSQLAQLLWFGTPIVPPLAVSLMTAISELLGCSQSLKRWLKIPSRSGRSLLMHFSRSWKQGEREGEDIIFPLQVH